MTTSVTRALTISAMLVSLSAGSSLSADDDAASTDDPRIKIGFELAHQQGVMLNKNLPAVGLGSYLVNAAGCNDCHTWPNYAPGGDPFLRQPKQVNVANYLGGGRAFALPTGNFCSRNLTPAPHTGMPAGLSRPDFIYVLQTGCDPQDVNFRDPQTCGLLQVMPWPQYQELQRRDLRAIYAYLSALPHAEPQGPAAPGGCSPDPQGVKGE